MNKVVLITGGSSGIGKAIGEFLHQKEFIVYGTSRNPEQITNSVFPLIALDVRNPESIQKAIQKVISLSGRIDILINNAGVGITGPLEEIPMTLAENSGFNAIEYVSNIKKMQIEESNPFIGVDAMSLGTNNMYEQGIFESVMSKKQQL